MPGDRTAAPARRVRPAGMLLRELREERRVSQYSLAQCSDVSQRHLSFVETGRTNPSRELIARLAGQLGLSLHDHHRLLLAAGHAPAPHEHRLRPDELGELRGAAGQIVRAQEPTPALLLDRRWDVVEHNRAVAPAADGIARPLLAPPVNLMRVSLHPQGLAPRIVNLGEWRHHMLARLRGQALVSGDGELTGLLAEVSAFPCDPPATARTASAALIPLRLRAGRGELAFFCVLTLFGAALDIAAAELTIATFFAADKRTASVLGRGRRAGKGS